MTESELALLRERNAADADAVHWKSIAGGLLLILAFIVIAHYYPDFFVFGLSE